MSHVLDLHIHLHEPFTTLLRETEQLLWDRNGKISKSGKPVHFKAETVRYAIQVANKQLKAEKAFRDSQPVPEPELTAQEQIEQS